MRTRSAGRCDHEKRRMYLGVKVLVSCVKYPAPEQGDPVSLGRPVWARNELGVPFHTEHALVGTVLVGTVLVYRWMSPLVFRPLPGILIVLHVAASFVCRR